MRVWPWIWIGDVVCPCLSCSLESSERSAFMAYVDNYSLSSSEQSDSGQGTGEGTSAAGEFRNPITVSFANYHTAAVLDTSFAAWINVSSIRTADQQDALLRAGYVQLTSPVTLGSVYSLPVGTFVYNGPGVAGATPVRLSPAGGSGETITPTTAEVTLTTPDVFLLFSQPPVSCDGVAFTYLDPQTGLVLEGASYFTGGYKTYAQVSAYECSPFKPGLFLNTEVSTTTNANVYSEGQPIAFDFFSGYTNAGAFCLVSIGTHTVATDPNEP